MQIKIEGGAVLRIRRHVDARSGVQCRGSGVEVEKTGDKWLVAECPVCRLEKKATIVYKGRLRIKLW